MLKLKTKMDEDNFALVEKIIKDLDNVLSKNAELSSFEIVAVEGNLQNKSPVIHFENHLGIESWCVKRVYLYCYNEIFDNYVRKHKGKPIKLTSVNSERLLKLLNLVLLINPEVSTFWNKRREIVSKSLVEKCTELEFSKLVLSWKGKCNEVYSYRRCILEGMIEDGINVLEILIVQDLQICKLASEKNPNNYHSWNHRMWVINSLKRLAGCDIELIYIQEYLFSEAWITKHVSDYSGCHYRQFCIKNIINSNSSIKITMPKLRSNLVALLCRRLTQDQNAVSEESLLSYSEKKLVHLMMGDSPCLCQDYRIICKKIEVMLLELVMNTTLVRFYKNHESLWYHRRFIVDLLLCIMYNYYGFIRQNGSLLKSECTKCASIGSNTDLQSDMFSSMLFNILVSHEIEFINEMSCEGDCFAVRHEKYMKMTHGFNNCKGLKT